MQPNNPHAINPIQWNNMISLLPGAHVLQSWEWGKVKSSFGWHPSFLLWFKSVDGIGNMANQIPSTPGDAQIVAAALVLQRNIRVGGFSNRTGVIYVPKGPLMDWGDGLLRRRVLQDLKEYAQKHSAIFIKIDPDLEIGVGIPGHPGSRVNQQAEGIVSELKAEGWLFSEEQIQFRNTVLIDLVPDEEKILANMKQKTRYNVNLARRKGVTIRTGNADDIDTLIRLYAETSLRDGFVIRNEEYYRQVWNTFIFSETPKRLDQPIAEALIAEFENEPIAAVIIFRFARKAWYLYGMSRTAHRDKMPNHLLQWEAIKRSRAAGCVVYDLWGAPNNFVETDPLWGVYRFKEGLGGTVHRFLGAWDLPINRMLYRLYTRTLPGLLDIMRRQGRENTRQAAGGT
jgi:lipid II:glycine glycyltransferase (peptidoglycan interpeptide bridge formation enzyme)